MTLISNFKTNQPTLVSFFYFLSFCLFLFLSHFPSTILQYSNATEVKHWSSWASWQDIFSKKTKCLWNGLMCQNKCTCRRVLAVMSFEWSRGISLMGRLCFLFLCILEGPGFSPWHWGSLAYRSQQDGCSWSSYAFQIFLLLKGWKL